MPEVSRIIRTPQPFFTPRLPHPRIPEERILPDKQTVERIVQSAMWKTINWLDRWIRDETKSPVPVYDPKNYPYKPGTKSYRPKTRQLLLSGRVTQSDEGFALEISWKTPYAKYLVEKGIAGTARARPYGGHRSLKWMGIVSRVGQLTFQNFMIAEARRQGLQISSFRRRAAS